MKMNLFTLVAALTIFGGAAADAKNLRVSNASSEDIPVISSTRKLQSSSSDDIPAVSSSRKLQSSSEDIPTTFQRPGLKIASSSEDTISSSRRIQSSSEDIPTISSTRRMLLTQAEMDSCYAVMDSTAVDDSIDTVAFVNFLNLLSFGYLEENDITSFDDLSEPLKFAWNTLTCQCKQMGGEDNCCEADRANLFVEGADGKPVSEEQTNFLNDICKTAISTLGSEGWENPAPGEMPIEKPLPVEPEPETLTPGEIIAMSIGIPLLFILLLLGTLYFCRDKDYKPEEEEVEDEELADVEKENVANDEDSAVGTVLTAEVSTVVESQA
jgi:hypothetical protein